MTPPLVFAVDSKASYPAMSGHYRYLDFFSSSISFDRLGETKWSLKKKKKEKEKK